MEYNMFVLDLSGDRSQLEYIQKLMDQTVKRKTDIWLLLISWTDLEARHVISEDEAFNLASDNQKIDMVVPLQEDPSHWLKTAAVFLYSTKNSLHSDFLAKFHDTQK